MKHDKLQELIKILLAQHDYITIADISEQLHVSQRTIHNYLEKPELLQMIQPAKLQRKPNKGIRLLADPLVKNTILTRLQTSINVHYDSEDDVCDILIQLLTSKEEITQEMFCSSLYMSPSSLSALLNEVELYIERFHCTLDHKKRKGSFISGTETHIRNLFYTFLTTQIPISETALPAKKRVSAKTLQILHLILQEKESEKLIHIMDISENIINTNYCDEDYNRLLLHLAIIVIRTRLGFYITNAGYGDITNSQEYYHATLQKTYLEKEFHILMNEQEVCHLALLLLGTRKQVNVSNNQQSMDVLEKFINLLSIRLNVELTNDYELKQNLLNHLKPAIHRMKHGVVSKNPLLEQIRLNFTEVYMAVVTTIEDLEFMEHIYFDSNEIGYICLHIIAAVNRPDNHKKIKTALVCNEGLSIEIFLKNIIESYFNELSICEIFRENSLQDLQPASYDLIINSTTQNLQGDNVVPIETNFTQKDHATLRHYLMFYTSGMVEADDVYRNYLQFFQDNVKDQQELIKKYSDYLYQKEYVKEGFYASVLSRTSISSTYIARGIALPHGAKDEVLSSVILMINLNTPILWDHEETDFVILVAANDIDVKTYSSLFRRIMKIAARDEYSTMLKACCCFEDLKELLEKV